MWAQLASTALGVWLMAAPSVMGYHGPARTNDHVVGPVVATFACVAIWEVTRPVRWGNVVLGLWLVLAPWVLAAGWAATANETFTGVVLCCLALVRGRLTIAAGGGWSALWRRPPTESSG